MLVHGFFLADEVTVDGDALTLVEPGLHRIVVAELPTAVTLNVVWLFHAAPGEDPSDYNVGLGRPDFSQTLNLWYFGGRTPGERCVHGPATLDVFEEGVHVLLLYPPGEGVDAIATYPFEVVLQD